MCMKDVAYLMHGEALQWRSYVKFAGLRGGGSVVDSTFL